MDSFQKRIIENAFDAVILYNFAKRVGIKDVSPRVNELGKLFAERRKVMNKNLKAAGSGK